MDPRDPRLEGLSFRPANAAPAPELTVEEIEESGFTAGIDLSKPDEEQDDFTRALINGEYDEDNTPASLMRDCKAKGNELFARGKPFYPNALRHWKAAIRHAQRVKEPTADDREVHSTVLSNRAAVYLARAAYDRVITDCVAAVEVWELNFKACFRAARAQIAKKDFDAAEESVQRGLAIEPKSKGLKKLKRQIAKVRAAAAKAEAEKKAKAEKAAKKRAALVAARQKTAQALRDACFERHITMGMAAFEFPAHFRGDVQLSRDNEMTWPVVFVYDEYSTSDFIQGFSELHTFRQQLEVVLPDTGAPAGWDEDGVYRVSNVNVYYQERAVVSLPPEYSFLESGDPKMIEIKELTERDAPNPDEQTWVQVPLDAPLLFALCQKRHVVPKYPVFHIVARDRPYYHAFYERRAGKIVKLQLPADARAAATGSGADPER